MKEILTIDEMRAKFDGEWVLVGDPLTDENLEVLKGTVLAHSPEKRDVYREGQKLRPRHSAMVCFLPPPKDLLMFL